MQYILCSIWGSCGSIGCFILTRCWKKLRNYRYLEVKSDENIEDPTAFGSKLMEDTEALKNWDAFSRHWLFLTLLLDTWTCLSAEALFFECVGVNGQFICGRPDPICKQSLFVEWLMAKLTDALKEACLELSLCKKFGVSMRLSGTIIHHAAGQK